MEPELKAEKTKSEWITCSIGYSPKITVCIRVENGTTPHEAKVIGLRGDCEAIYVKIENLEKLSQVLLPFLTEVKVAKVRTMPPPEDAAEVLLPQEEFAKVRMAERKRCLDIVESYYDSGSGAEIIEHIAEDIAALIRTESLK